MIINVSHMDTINEGVPSLKQLSDGMFLGKYIYGATADRGHAVTSQVDLINDSTEDVIISGLTVSVNGYNSNELGYSSDSSFKMNYYIFRREDVLIEDEETGEFKVYVKRQTEGTSRKDIPHPDLVGTEYNNPNGEGVPLIGFAAGIPMAASKNTTINFFAEKRVVIPAGETESLIIFVRKPDSSGSNYITRVPVKEFTEETCQTLLPLEISKPVFYNAPSDKILRNFIRTLKVKWNISESNFGINSNNPIEKFSARLYYRAKGTTIDIGQIGDSKTIEQDFENPIYSYEEDFSISASQIKTIEGNEIYCKVTPYGKYYTKGGVSNTISLYVNKQPGAPSLEILDSVKIENDTTARKYKVYFPYGSKDETTVKNVCKITAGGDSDTTLPSKSILSTTQIAQGMIPGDPAGSSLLGSPYSPVLKYSDSNRYFLTWDGKDASTTSFITIRRIKNGKPTLMDKGAIAKVSTNVGGIPNGRLDLQTSGSAENNLVYYPTKPDNFDKENRKILQLKYKIVITDSEGAVLKESEEFFSSARKATDTTHLSITRDLIQEELVSPGEYYKIQYSAYDGIDWTDYETLTDEDEKPFLTLNKLVYSKDKDKIITVTNTYISTSNSGIDYSKSYKKPNFKVSFKTPDNTAPEGSGITYHLSVHYKLTQNDSDEAEAINEGLATQSENSDITEWNISQSGLEEVAFYIPYEKEGELSERYAKIYLRFYQKDTNGRVIQSVDSNIGTCYKAYLLKFSEAPSSAYKVEYNEDELLKNRKACVRINFLEHQDNYIDSIQQIKAADAALTISFPKPELTPYLANQNGHDDLIYSLYKNINDEYTLIGDLKTQKVDDNDTINLSWSYNDISTAIGKFLSQYWYGTWALRLEIKDPFGNITFKNFSVKFDMRERPQKPEHKFLGTTQIILKNINIPPERYVTGSNNSLVEGEYYYIPKINNTKYCQINSISNETTSPFFPWEFSAVDKECLLVLFDKNEITSYTENISKAIFTIKKTSSEKASEEVIMSYSINNFIEGDYKSNLYEISSKTGSNNKILPLPLINLDTSNFTSNVECKVYIQFEDKNLAQRASIENLERAEYTSDEQYVGSFILLPRAEINLELNQENIPNIAVDFNNGKVTYNGDILNRSWKNGEVNFTDGELLTAAYSRETLRKNNESINSTKCSYYWESSIYSNFIDIKLQDFLSAVDNWSNYKEETSFPVIVTGLTPQSPYCYIRGKVEYSEGTEWDGVSLKDLKRVIYSNIEIKTNRTPTVAYRQNAVGINHTPSDNHFFEAHQLNEDKNKIHFLGFKNMGGDEGLLYYSLQLDFDSGTMGYNTNLDTSLYPKVSPLLLSPNLIPSSWVWDYSITDGEYSVAEMIKYIFGESLTSE